VIIRTTIIPAIVLLLASLPAEAGASCTSAACECEGYKSSAETIIQMARSAEIIVKVSHMPETLEKIRRQAARAVPEKCWDTLGISHFLKPAISVSVRYSRGGNLSGYNQSGAEASRLLDTYLGIMMKYGLPCTGMTAAALTTCLNNLYKKRFEYFDQAIKDPENNQLMRREFAKLPESDQRIIRLFHAIISEKDVLGYLKKNRGRHTPEEILAAVQMFGSQANAFYDFARADKQNGRDKGAVSLDQIKNNMVTNFSRGFYSNGNEAPVPGNTAGFWGVCRDIMAAQGQLLEAAGFRNNYMVGFQTRNGGHQTLISQHPSKNIIYRLDYGTLIEPERAGTTALYGGGGDQAIQYDIYKLAGRKINVTMSEFGRFMSEASGFDVKTINPLARPSGYHAGTNISLTKGAHHDVSFRSGAGEDGTGAKHFYGGLHASAGKPYTSSGELRVGSIYAQSVRSGLQMGLANGETLSLDVFYNQFQYRLGREIKLKPKVFLRLEALASTVAALVINRDGSDGNSGKKATTFEALAGARVSIDQGDMATGRFSSSLSAAAMSGIGRKDSRVSNSNSKFLPFLQYFLFSAEGRYKLASTPLGRSFLIMSTRILVDEFGSRGTGEVGMTTPKAGISARLEGRIKAPLFLDMSERRFGASATYNISDLFYLMLDLSTPLEKRTDMTGTKRGTQLFLNAGVRH